MIGQMNGAIDEAMQRLCNIEHTLARIADNQEDDAQTQRTFKRSDGFVIADALAGERQTTLYMPPGVAWDLKSFSVSVTAASALTAGYLAFYIDQEKGTNLIKVVSLAGVTLLDDAFLDGHYVPEQSALLIVARLIAGPAAVAISGRVASRGIPNGQPRKTVGYSG